MPAILVLPTPSGTEAELVADGRLIIVGQLTRAQITGPDVALWAPSGAALWLIRIRIISDEDQDRPATTPIR